MSQSLVLTTPIIPTVPSTTTYVITRMLLVRVPVASVVIGLVDNTGQAVEALYSDNQGGTVAAQLISALNTANLSIKSLQQRILEKLVADGKLPAGAVTGVPD